MEPEPVPTLRVPDASHEPPSKPAVTPPGRDMVMAMGGYLAFIGLLIVGVSVMILGLSIRVAANPNFLAFIYLIQGLGYVLAGGGLLAAFLQLARRT